MPKREHTLYGNLSIKELEEMVAQNGSLHEQTMLARRYLDAGRKPEEAQQLLFDAAQRGYIPAQVALGGLALCPRGTREQRGSIQNLAVAVKLLTAAGKPDFGDVQERVFALPRILTAKPS